MASPPVAVLEDPRYRLHEPPADHPEAPDRLRAVAAAVAARSEELLCLQAREAEDSELLAVHSRAHVEQLATAGGDALRRLDPDTYASRHSERVARLAAGGAIEAARAVVRGAARAAFAAVRPPGHHAEAERAMGFCLYNNVAVAARALQREEGVERVLILDWDVHHGNGVQELFAAERDVLYFSLHQFPWYPGTGAAGEVGHGAGVGSTWNVPLRAGCGDVEYGHVLRRVAVPIARDFRPEVVLVSCGFDAHRDDPLGGMAVSAAGFSDLGRVVRALADELCGGRLVLVLEGGYAETGLREGCGAVLDALLAEDGAAPPDPPPLDAQSPVYAAIEALRAAHPGHPSAFGALP